MLCDARSALLGAPLLPYALTSGSFAATTAERCDVVSLINHLRLSMNSRQRNALVEFSQAVQELRAAGVIRSHRYLGDIAEFICAHAKNLVLEENLRAPGHDGMVGNNRVQVKYGGSTKTNVSLGNPDAYDEILVVLGPESVLREAAEKAEFLIFTLTADEVRTSNPCGNGTFSCGKGGWKGKIPHRVSLEALVTPISAVPELTHKPT